MKTYAVVYKFADGKAAQEFKNSTVESFGNVREKDTETFHYIGFAGGKEPEIEDKLAGILRHIGYSTSLTDGDFVGVYFSPDYDEDDIKRQMAFGRDEDIDSVVTPNKRPEHVSIITDLLDYDPVKDKNI